MGEVHVIAWDENGVPLLWKSRSTVPRTNPLQERLGSMTVLPHDSRAIQDETKQGRWLIYIWAEWNCHEAAELLMCAKSADKLAGTVAMGVRPYSHYSDIPAFKINPYRTPCWVVLSDGKILGQKSGFLTPDEIIGFVRQSLAAPRKEKTS